MNVLYDKGCIESSGPKGTWSEKVTSLKEDRMTTRKPQNCTPSTPITWYRLT